MLHTTKCKFTPTWCWPRVFTRLQRVLVYIYACMQAWAYMRDFFVINIWPWWKAPICLADIQSAREIKQWEPRLLNWICYCHIQQSWAINARSLHSLVYDSIDEVQWHSPLVKNHRVSYPEKMTFRLLLIMHCSDTFASDWCLINR